MKKSTEFIRRSKKAKDGGNLRLRQTLARGQTFNDYNTPIRQDKQLAGVK